VTPGNRLLYATMRATSALACWLPARAALGAGRLFADGLFGVYRLTPYRGFVEGNIRAALSLAEPEARDLARLHLRSLVTSIVELMRFPRLRPQDLAQLVTFQGLEHLEAARARGRGVIVLTAHFGNWELMGAAIAQLCPLSVLVQPPSKDAFERLFIEYRAMFGVSTHPNTGPASLRPILRALGRNEAIALLSDQHGEAQDAFATLFGHPVSVPVGAHFLAERTGAAIVPAFIERLSDDRHVLTFEPELVCPDAQRFAEAYTAILEARVKARPDHWLWVHDRWAREGELRPREGAACPA